MPLAQRKHLRRLSRIYCEGAPLYLVTCCTRDRRRLLATRAAAEVLVASWRDARAVHGWLVGRYVVMPDHVHFFVTPLGDRAKTLSRFIECWKRWTRRELRRRGVAIGWQREFFDHLLRSSESYGAKWEYVRMNPVRAGLAGGPDEWPYQGEIAVLGW